MIFSIEFYWSQYITSINDKTICICFSKLKNWRLTTNDWKRKMLLLYELSVKYLSNRRLCNMQNLCTCFPFISVDISFKWSSISKKGLFLKSFHIFTKTERDLFYTIFRLSGYWWCSSLITFWFVKCIKKYGYPY